MKTLITTLRASSARTIAAGATVSGEAVKLQENYEQLVVTLDVTIAATAAGDTLDVFIDTSFDGGTTWVNIGKFTQVLGNGGAKKFLMSFKSNPIASSNVVPIGTDQTAGNALQIGFGDRIRYRDALTDATTQDASFTYSVSAFLK